jgi:hypothetical protein
MNLNGWQRVHAARRLGIVTSMVVICAGFYGRTAVAADQRDASFYVLSEGNATCGEFIAQPEMKSVRLAWVLGYLSGRNREAQGAERMIGTSLKMPATTLAWLDHYCAGHALDVLFIAADKLRAEALKHER